jgi:hypothetical protein
MASHIELWEENKDKMLKAVKPLNAQPNRHLNQFLDAVDVDNYIESMQTLLREDHVRLKIVVERINITTQIKE